MNLEQILHREQDIPFLLFQDHCETVPNFALIIGRVAKPIVWIIINALKNTTKNAR